MEGKRRRRKRRQKRRWEDKGRKGKGRKKEGIYNLDWRHRTGCFEMKATPSVEMLRKILYQSSCVRVFCVEWEIEIVWKSSFIV